MRLQAGAFRYLTRDDIRILTSVEMGLKNHEYVPEQLIESIAHLRRCGVFGRIQVLMKHGLLHHEGGKGDGYKLTYNGYDCLALRAMTIKGVITSIGTRIGVGKESDIHMCTDENESPLVVKFHRLGRISFRTVKTNRDYLQGRSHASWMYLARLAAQKEFQYMLALYEAGFPVPKPIENNRHAILMEYMEGSIPLYHTHPMNVPEEWVPIIIGIIFKLLVRFASCGLIHGDYNEFNLMIDLSNLRKITVIDFPQIISMDHPEAKIQFERDVNCICRFFRKRFRYEIDQPPTWEDAKLAYANGKENTRIKVESTGEDDLLLKLKLSRQDEDRIEEDLEADSEDQEIEADEECDQIDAFDASDDGASDTSDASESSDASDASESSPVDKVIVDPRYILRKKKKAAKALAPRISIVEKPGQSNAKPNKQKRGQHSNAAREVRAWKTEGGW